MTPDLALHPLANIFQSSIVWDKVKYNTAWYRKAAEPGEAVEQFNLGLVYSTGEGVPQDYVEAHMWRNLAAARATDEDQKRYAETRDATA